MIAFAFASAFNSDLSKWKTARVSLMKNSMYTCTSFLRLFLFEQKTQTANCKRYIKLIVWPFFLFSFCCLTVFDSAYAFNSSLVIWDTNSVTTMQASTFSFWNNVHKLFTILIIQCITKSFFLTFYFDVLIFFSFSALWQWSDGYVLWGCLGKTYSSRQRVHWSWQLHCTIRMLTKVIRATHVCTCVLYVH